MKKVKSNKFYSWLFLYFTIFGLLPFLAPLFFRRLDDIALYIKFLIFVFPVLLVFFIFAYIKYLIVTKEKTFLIIGSIILYYFLSAVYLFLRITSDFSDFRYGSF